MSGRTKKKDWKRAGFSLKKETLEKLEAMVNNTGLGKSEIIDNLVSRESTNDVSKIKTEIGFLNNQITTKEFEISELKKARKSKEEILEKMIKWKAENSNDALEAIEIIKKLLLNNRYKQAETYARSRTDVDMEWIEMIYRAKEELEVAGI